MKLVKSWAKRVLDFEKSIFNRPCCRGALWGWLWWDRLDLLIGWRLCTQADSEMLPACHDPRNRWEVKAHHVHEAIPCIRTTTISLILVIAILHIVYLHISNMLCCIC